MSTESDKTESTEEDAKTKLASEVVRPPDPLRDSKNNPERPGFRNKPNKGSKAQKAKRKKRKK